MKANYLKNYLLPLVLCLVATVGISQTFTVDNLNYQVISTTPNEVALTGGTPATTDLVIPATVIDNGITYNVTAIKNSAFQISNITSVVIGSNVSTIGKSAFQGSNITTVVLGSNVSTIEDDAFRFASSLIAVESQATTPPIQGSSVFTDRNLIDLTVPTGTEQAYRSNGWGTFRTVNGELSIGFIFDLGDLSYRVTSNSPNTVVVRSRAASSTSVNIVIPNSVVDPFTSATYNVTAIGNRAFQNSNITSVVIGSNVSTIGNEAFSFTPLIAVESQAITPPIQGSGVFTDRNLIDITVPAGTEQAYASNGWGGFRTVNGELSIGFIFDLGDLSYRVTSNSPNTVEVRSRAASSTSVNIVIPNSVVEPFTSATYNVTAIGNSAFRASNITNVVIGSNVSTIGNEAFRFTPLIAVESQATMPPILGSSVFTDRNLIDLTVPAGTEQAYASNGWGGFKSINGVSFQIIGNTFTVNNLNYTIISVFPNTVEITGATSVPSILVIDDSVSNAGIDFTVTSITASALSGLSLTSVVLPNTITGTGFGAFTNNVLTSIELPEGITTISKQSFQSNQLSTIELPSTTLVVDNNAFRNNQLTEVTLPASVANIGTQAFENNPIIEVTSFNIKPPSIAGSSFSNRNQITLNIPVGTRAVYEAEGWIGFGTINEFEIIISVAPKVYLQGASLNPIAGEEALMRDNLRENEQLFTISPYDQGDTNVSSTVFETTGANAIVDWVFVELRDQNDSSFVLEDKSALLQRDGDIVDTDGISPLSFTVAPGDYFISINHRNHLGVISAEPVTLALNATTAVDFTNPTLVQGGTTALIEVNDIFTMIGGDPSEDGQVLSTDITEVVSDIGSSGYRNADLDMNGQVLSTDVIIGNQNIGRGQQFSDPVQAP